MSLDHRNAEAGALPAEQLVQVHIHLGQKLSIVGGALLHPATDVCEHLTGIGHGESDALGRELIAQSVPVAGQIIAMPEIRVPVLLRIGGPDER
jgi:hypothetical protein